MPSGLRLQSTFNEPIDAQATYHTSPSFSPAKKQKMSLTNTYYVASTARSKLGREASRPDHNLRLLVGHANLLDSLMIELADAEREQEAWFNESVKKAAKPNEPRHIQWIDSIAEAEDEEYSDSDADSDASSDFYDEDEDIFTLALPTKIATAPVIISSSAIEVSDSDEEMDDDDDYDEELNLSRVASRYTLSPPDLTHDSSESDSEDDSMPSSPEESNFELSEKDRQSITTTSFYSPKSQSGLEDYIQQQSQQQSQPLIAAY
ncbi:Hypothetical protein R9X50_00577400 [Acrodontium crateriforme]|uniref:Uncharacterized protein n=1 Tax=Acrodontium crateriforme TaxID=150365 RepID=A0AAQ3MAD3_9PEZI|nr:Hypothetical protein R9X50_00577400 [Acrodontium crateriforme]